MSNLTPSQANSTNDTFSLLNSINSKSYSKIYHAWYSIPFVYEIKTLLEWTFTKTSLSYGDWIKIKDIEEQLYITHCENKEEKRKAEKRNRKEGNNRNDVLPQQNRSKCWHGWCKVIFFLIILSFPLIFMSTAMPIFDSMKPLSFEIQFTLGDSGELFSQYWTQTNNISYTEINNYLCKNVYGSKTDKCKPLESDTRTQYFYMDIPLYSLHYWDVSSASKSKLSNSLCSENETYVLFGIDITMSRQESAASNTFSYTQKRHLSEYERLGLCNITKGYLILDNFTITTFPQFLRMPSLQESSLTQMENRGERFELYPEYQLDYQNNNYFWSFKNNINENNTETARIFIESPEVPEDIVGISTISSMGSLAIYTGIIFVIYNYFKTDYIGASHSIMFERMENCEGLLQWCEEIHSARKNGDLDTESFLANELLEIYRSPEKIIEKTS